MTCHKLTTKTAWALLTKRAPLNSFHPVPWLKLIHNQTALHTFKSNRSNCFNNLIRIQANRMWSSSWSNPNLIMQARAESCKTSRKCRRGWSLAGSRSSQWRWEDQVQSIPSLHSQAQAASKHSSLQRASQALASSPTNARIKFQIKPNKMTHRWDCLVWN